MKAIFVFLFWPNPGNASYASPKAVALLAVCLALIAAALVLSFLRKRSRDASFRKLSRTWATASFWFGLIGLLLVVARVEQIQFVAMRVWWLLWLLFFAAYLFFQIRLWRTRHFTVLPRERVDDPRTQYLPKQKRVH